MKVYKFSITTGTEQETNIICNETKNQSLFFAEFVNYQDLINYLNSCFVLIKKGIDFNYYIKKESEDNKW